MPEIAGTPARRRGAFLALVSVCAVVAVGSVAFGVAGAPDAPSAPAGTGDVVPVPATHVPERAAVVFRSLAGKDPAGHGKIAWTALGDPHSKRVVGGLDCARVHFAAGRGICLASGGSPLSSFAVQLLGPDLKPRGEVRVNGAPSRARVSPDGRFGTVTTFVSGHSYADSGGFSTQTTLIDMARGKVIAELEDFDVTREGKAFRSIDFNFWGVTFAPDGDGFYATLGTSGTSYLVRGDVDARTAEVLRENAECPSLSPDGRRVVYKKRMGEQGRWRYHVLDLESGRETALAETRPIDDQAEWLDANAVLYRFGTDVWVVPADGGGSPRRFLTQADSPAVIRE